MPYHWINNDTASEDSEAVSHHLRLWAYNSLKPRGFVWFIAVTAMFLALPLIGLLGSAVMWGMLPFLLVVLGGMWWALKLSWARHQVTEELILTRDQISLTHHDKSGIKQWQAPPYWIRAQIRPGPVEDYLVLTGDHQSHRDIELGSFLTPAERRDLQLDLNRRLATLRDSFPRP